MDGVTLTLMQAAAEAGESALAAKVAELEARLATQEEITRQVLRQLAFQNLPRNSWLYDKSLHCIGEAT